MRSNLTATYNQKFLMGEVIDINKDKCLVKIRCGTLISGFLNCLILGNRDIQLSRLPLIGELVAAIIFDANAQVGVVLGPVMFKETKCTVEAEGGEKDITIDAQSLKSTIKKLILEALTELNVGPPPYGSVVTTQCICHFTGSPHGMGATTAKIGGPLGAG